MEAQPPESTRAPLRDEACAEPPRPLMAVPRAASPLPPPSALMASYDQGDDDEDDEEEIMSSVRLPVRKQSSSGSASASGDPASASASAGPMAAARSCTHAQRLRRGLGARNSSSGSSSGGGVRGGVSPTCGLRRSTVVVQESEDGTDGCASVGGGSIDTVGGNEADDEDEDEDSVFAHVVIGAGAGGLRRSGGLSIQQQQQTSHRITQHRQSNSFELGSNSQQRQKHLRFLRTVNSAQARLNRELSADKENHLAAPPEPNKAQQNNQQSQRKKNFLSVERENSKDDDEDEGDENSIGGLGKRIRKLSSRTIEFCDSIDESRLLSPSSSSSAAAAGLRTSVSLDRGGAVSAKAMGNELKKGAGGSLAPPSPGMESRRTTSMDHSSSQAIAVPPFEVTTCYGASGSTGNNNNTSLKRSAPVEHHVSASVGRERSASALTASNAFTDRGAAGAGRNLFSLSVESDTSHYSHESVSTVVTNTTLTPSPAQSHRGSNASGTAVSASSAQDGAAATKKQSLPSFLPATAPTFTGALSSLASSFMSNMRNRSSSETRRASNMSLASRKDSSTDRPLTLNETLASTSAPYGQGPQSYPQQRPPYLEESHLQGRQPQWQHQHQPQQPQPQQQPRVQQQPRGRTPPQPQQSRPSRNAFRRQDTPHAGAEAEYQYGPSGPVSVPSAPSSRRGGLNARLATRLSNMYSDGSSSSQSQSFGSCDYHTPPSIVCTEVDDDSSRHTSNSSTATQRTGTDSLDYNVECDTPVMDEFAQFLNASIHPPNELSVPRCYPYDPPSPTLLHPLSMPSSRRSSAARGGVGGVFGSDSYRNARSLSLGYQSYQSRRESMSPSPVQVHMVMPQQHHLHQQQQYLNPLASPCGSRPILRRESAQDFGDDEESSVGSPKMRLCLPKQPPDLKIDLLSESESATTPSSVGPYARAVSLSPYSSLDEMGGGAPYARRHSHCQRPPPIARNRSAPATPLSRSTTNVAQQIRMDRSPSKDGYLMVPERQRGASLPEQKRPEGDLYRLRQFTVSNKRIVKRSDSLQPRRSWSSLQSTPSSSVSPSPRSSLRSSTEDDDPCSSKNSSLCPPRYTVLMLGGSEVGKTLLTAQFMSGCDVGAYSQLTEDDYDEKCVSVLLDSEEAELVFIDHPSAEISVENAVATYIPDAMVVVYSVVSPITLQEAEETLQYLWKTNTMTEKAVIMVGNKTDLVRTRAVNIVDAKAVATSYDCKYTETSATLKHNVDELLVGILTQIRLKLAEKTRFSRGATGRKLTGRSRLLGGGGSSGSGGSGGSAGHVPRRKSAGLKMRGLLGKVLGADTKSKSCDDLHVL